MSHSKIERQTHAHVYAKYLHVVALLERFLQFIRVEIQQLLHTSQNTVLVTQTGSPLTPLVQEMYLEVLVLRHDGDRVAIGALHNRLQVFQISRDHLSSSQDDPTTVCERHRAERGDQDLWVCTFTKSPLAKRVLVVDASRFSLGSAKPAVYTHAHKASHQISLIPIPIPPHNMQQ